MSIAVVLNSYLLEISAKDLDCAAKVKTFVAEKFPLAVLAEEYGVYLRYTLALGAAADGSTPAPAVEAEVPQTVDIEDLELQIATTEAKMTSLSGQIAEATELKKFDELSPLVCPTLGGADRHCRRGSRFKVAATTLGSLVSKSSHHSCFVLFSFLLQGEEMTCLSAKLRDMKSKLRSLPASTEAGGERREETDGGESSAKEEVHLSEIFREIEGHKVELGVAQYSLSQPTLEQVFIRIAKTVDAEEGHAPTTGS